MKESTERIIEGLQKPTWTVGYPSDVSELLDLLEIAEGALIDSISCEDGLDGDTGLRVLKMISGALVTHGRLSLFVQVPEK